MNDMGAAPTAVAHRIDLSPASDRASAPPIHSVMDNALTSQRDALDNRGVEPTEYRGREMQSIYSNVLPMRSEPCACGGVIASVDAEPFIRLAVQAHNDQPQHCAWRVGQ